VLDLILAYLHHLAVFGVVGLMFAELVLVRPGLSGNQLVRVGKLDGAYGFFSGLVIVAGVLRVLFGEKGWGFYSISHVFWTKMALFLLIGILSIIPTMALIRWNKAAKADAAYVVPDGEIVRARRFIHLELAVLIFIPLAAAAMARGY
jgi:putative membrane protein